MALLAVGRRALRHVPRPYAGRHLPGLFLGVAAALGSVGRWLAAVLARASCGRFGHVRRLVVLPLQPVDDVAGSTGQRANRFDVGCCARWLRINRTKKAEELRTPCLNRSRGFCLSRVSASFCLLS